MVSRENKWEVRLHQAILDDRTQIFTLLVNLFDVLCAGVSLDFVNRLVPCWYVDKWMFFEKEAPLIDCCNFHCINPQVGTACASTDIRPGLDQFHWSFHIMMQS